MKEVKTFNSYSKLIIEKFKEVEQYDTNGNLIKANVTSEKLQRYLSARERKLKLMDYYFEVIGNKENVFLFTGIDDSSTSKNIQTNEIDYMNKKAKEEGINVGRCYESNCVLLKFIYRNRNLQCDCIWRQGL